MKLPAGIITNSIPVWLVRLFDKLKFVVLVVVLGFDELEFVDLVFAGVVSVAAGVAAALGFAASKVFNLFFANAANFPFGYCSR